MVAAVVTPSSLCISPACRFSLLSPTGLPSEPLSSTCSTLQIKYYCPWGNGHTESRASYYHTFCCLHCYCCKRSLKASSRSRREREKGGKNSTLGSKQWRQERKYVTSKTQACPCRAVSTASHHPLHRVQQSSVYCCTGQTTASRWPLLKS